MGQKMDPMCALITSELIKRIWLKPLCRQSSSCPVHSMASIDPTPEEMQQWTDISSVISWAGLAGDPTEAASPAGSFFRHLGFTSTAPVRVLGMISATDLTEFLKDWKIVGENATPAQRAQAALVGSGARVAAGTQRTVADSRIAAAVALAAASATAPAAAPAATSGVPVLYRAKTRIT